MFEQKAVILLGAPGCGKSSMLCGLKEKGIPVKSFSIRVYTQMLSHRKDELAEEILRVAVPKKIMPISLVEKIVNVFIEDVKDEDFVVFEGFPINQEQAELAKKLLLKGNRKIDAVVYLCADKDVIKKRVLKRKVCPSCEREKLVGISYDDSDTYCKICGKELQTREEDTNQRFEKRYKLHIDQREYILNILNDIKKITIDTSDLSKEEVVDKVIEEINNL